MEHEQVSDAGPGPTGRGATVPGPGPGPEAIDSGPARRSLRSRLPDEAGVIVALVALVILIGIANPNFLLPRSLGQLLSSAAFTGMLATGMVFVIVIRDIDLSDRHRS